MRKFRGVPPARQQSFGFRRICRNQFDCDFANVRGIVVRQKYGAAFVSAHEFAQAEFSVNDLAHPSSSRPRSSEPPCTFTSASRWRAAAGTLVSMRNRKVSCLMSDSGVRVFRQAIAWRRGARPQGCGLPGWVGPGRKGWISEGTPPLVVTHFAPFRYSRRQKVRPCCPIAPLSADWRVSRVFAYPISLSI